MGGQEESGGLASELFLRGGGRGAPGMPEAGVSLPDRIGQYRIVGLIAAGGMGAVYEAEQDNPSRSVALKVMRADAISPGAVRRFEYEAQVLGLLQHPGIAQIFEAGTFDAGHGAQPFFAMELIDGRPLTEDAASRGLGAKKRLELFVRVCDAVHYAHQKGVVHRDLKPTNILVDRSGQPKILDFGVARATGSDLKATTLRTGVGELVGTLPYMSPEQVGGDPDDVDIRTDVYALGVVLYEMLSGRLPYDVKDQGIAEAARIICDGEATPLSSIDRVFRGDLETIADKALEKEKDRRYQSAAELATDVRCHLGNEPIAARSPSAVYQLRKFARRHKAAFAAAVVAVIALVAATAVSATFAVEATRQRNEAQQALAQSLVVSDLMLKVISSEAAMTSNEDTVPIVQLIYQAEKALEAAQIDDPAVEATLREYIGRGYLNRNEVGRADEHLTGALDIRRNILATTDAALAESVELMADLRIRQGRVEEGKELLREALRIRREVFGANHFDAYPDDELLAMVVAYVGEEPEAQEYIHRAERLRDRASKSDGVHLAKGPSVDGEVVLDDHFDGENLDAGWSVRLDRASGWMYSVEDSRLIVTDVEPLSDRQESMARVNLVRGVATLEDFSVRVDLGWDSDESLWAYQFAGLALFDRAGAHISDVWYHDGWSAWSGERRAAIGKHDASPARAASGFDTLPLSGTASIEIWRSADMVTVSWDGHKILKGVSTEPLAEVAIFFGWGGHFASAGHETFLGSLWVDQIRVEGVPSNSSE